MILVKIEYDETDEEATEAGLKFMFLNWKIVNKILLYKDGRARIDCHDRQQIILKKSSVDKLYEELKRLEIFL